MRTSVLVKVSLTVRAMVAAAVTSAVEVVEMAVLGVAVEVYRTMAVHISQDRA